MKVAGLTALILMSVLFSGGIRAWGQPVLITGGSQPLRRKALDGLLLGIPQDDRQFVEVRNQDEYFVLTVKEHADPRSRNFFVLEKIFEAPEYQLIMTCPKITFAVPVLVAEKSGDQLKAVPVRQAEGYDVYMSSKEGLFGLTLMPMVTKLYDQYPYSPDKYIRVYVASDQSPLEMAATVHHELRHVYLLDGGYQPLKGLHGDPGVNEDIKFAVAEARRNARVRLSGIR